MSISLLLSIIDEVCKSGSITTESHKYLLKKAVEYGISTEMVEKMLTAKNVNIVETIQVSK